MAESVASALIHPYVPRDLHLPDFVPGSLSQFVIIGVFVISALIVVIFAWIVSGWMTKTSRTDRILICWWAFTGLTHLLVEGYYVVSPNFYKDKTGCFFAELWKEYSKGDSRYASRDSGVVSVEAVTVLFEGPASLLAVYAIGAKKTYSHVLQLSICLGQLYGLILYFMTSFLDGANFSSTSSYFYLYFIGANAPWLFIPIAILVRSWKILIISHPVTTGELKKLN